MSSRPLDLVRACLNAYVSKDREAIEAILADNFHFTSPLDNRLDRDTYFARCWPNSARTAGFEYIYSIEHGDRAFITYEARSTDGKRFRNTEVHTAHGGRIVETEVYFGWNLPHEAPEGGFIGKDGAPRA